MGITMRDVAVRAGVSVATVSHVLNQTRFVTESTRQKVLEVIDELGYRPDTIARSFKTGKKNIIGIIVPDIANPVWAMIIEEIEAVLSNKGYRLIICNTKETKERELEHVHSLTSGLVDGLIIASTLSEYEPLSAEIPDGFPVVFIDRFPKGCPHDLIISNDSAALYQGVEKLITVDGHSRIGFITGLMRISTSVERLNAYKKAMNDYGLPIEDNFIQPGNSLAKNSVLQVQKLLEQKCTAIVVSNNIMADDVLFYLNDNGIHLGKDISILGQSIEGQRDYNLRRMDLFVQPIAEMGRAAGQQILDRLSEPDMPIRHIILNSSYFPSTCN